MLAQQKQHILALFENALAPILAGTGLTPTISLERPRDPAHGDIACNIAMQLAKPLKKNPRELAQTIVAALLANPARQELIESADIAGPGFINLRVPASAKQNVIRTVLRQAENFGKSHRRCGQKSDGRIRLRQSRLARLHVGHGRQGALGDALAALLESQGYEVTREFYYNDAGVQIATLAHSVQCRARGWKPGDPLWPADAYNGDYIADIAADYLAKKTVEARDGQACNGERRCGRY